MKHRTIWLIVFLSISKLFSCNEVEIIEKEQIGLEELNEKIRNHYKLEELAVNLINNLNRTLYLPKDVKKEFFELANVAMLSSNFIEFNNILEGHSIDFRLTFILLSCIRRDLERKYMFSESEFDEALQLSINEYLNDNTYSQSRIQCTTCFNGVDGCTLHCLAAGAAYGEYMASQGVGSTLAGAAANIYVVGCLSGCAYYQ